MFSEILRRYDELISKLDLYSVQKCVDAFLEINRSRLERKKELSAKNEFEAYKRAQQLVKEFLASDDDSDFLPKLKILEVKRSLNMQNDLRINADNGMKYLTTRKNNSFCC